MLSHGSFVHAVLLVFEVLSHYRCSLCLGQYFLEDFEEYPTVKPFEAGKFQKFVPHVDVPFSVGQKPKGPLSPILENAYIPEDVLAILLPARNDTTYAGHTVTGKSLPGHSSVLPAPEKEAISDGWQGEKKRPRSQASGNPLSTREEEAAPPGRRQPKQPDPSASSHRDTVKIKMQALEEGTVAQANGTYKSQNAKGGRRFSSVPLAEHLQKAGHIIRAERPSAGELGPTVISGRIGRFRFRHTVRCSALWGKASASSDGVVFAWTAAYALQNVAGSVLQMMLPFPKSERVLQGVSHRPVDIWLLSPPRPSRFAAGR